MPWDKTPEEAVQATAVALQKRVKKVVRAILLRYAVEIDAWMKTNAPWTDQTGNLRQSLHAWVEELGDLISLSFDYGLNYGKYLEFSNEGRFAIIAPALDYFWPKIVADIQAALR